MSISPNLCREQLATQFNSYIQQGWRAGKEGEGEKNL